MYICCECGHVFDEPKKYSEDRTPGGAFEGGSFIYHYTGCPYCGGTYDEAILCPRCEDTYVSLENSDVFCDDCIKDLVYTYKKLIADNFREDEYGVLWEHLDSIDPFKKGED